MISSLFVYPGMVDIRALLPRAPWSIGRRPASTSITVHYSGPPVPDSMQRGGGLLAQLRVDATWQMQSGWGGTKAGSDGLQYHFVVDADGRTYQARDVDALLWHCGHQDGNTNGLSVHLPLGGEQDATPAQWEAGLALIGALRVRYGVSLRRVLGHQEWKHATLCPGRLQPRVAAYRANLEPDPIKPTPAPGLRRFQVRPELELPARVRQSPHQHWPDGSEVGVAGRLKPGTIIYVDVVKADGESIGGDSRWVHMARVPNEQADLGFVHYSLVVEL